MKVALWLFLVGMISILAGVFMYVQTREGFLGTIIGAGIAMEIAAAVLILRRMVHGRRA